MVNRSIVPPGTPKLPNWATYRLPSGPNRSPPGLYEAEIGVRLMNVLAAPVVGLMRTIWFWSVPGVPGDWVAAYRNPSRPNVRPESYVTAPAGATVTGDVGVAAGNLRISPP